MKKLTCTLLALCLFAAAFAGCGSTAAQPPAAERPDLSGEALELSILIEYEMGPLSDAIEQFIQLNPNINVTVEKLIYPILADPTTTSDREAQIQRLRSEILAGRGPDVFVLGTPMLNDGVFTDIQKAMQNGVFADLAPLLAQFRSLEEIEVFTPVIEAGVLNGKQYVLPLSFSLPLLVSTQQNIDTLGLTPAIEAEGQQAWLRYLMAAIGCRPA